MQLTALSLALTRIGLGGFGVGSALNLDFTSGNQSLDPRITFTRASTATRVNASGVLESVAIDGPRFDYDPVTLAPKGLLIEEQRTNLMTFSEQFDNAYWGKINASVASDNSASPDGTTTSDKLVENTATGTHIASVSGVAISSAVIHTVSVYAKAAGRSFIEIRCGASSQFKATFSLTDGSASSTLGLSGSGATDAGNGWWRVWISFISDSTSLSSRIGIAQSASINSYTGDGVSGLFLWGAQLEAGAFPTSYIPTTEAAATRAADGAVMTGANFSNWYRQDEGTLFAEGDAGLGTLPCFASIDDATVNNRIQLRRTNGDTVAALRMVAPSGSIDVTLTSGSAVGLNKQAASFSAGNQNAAANGALFTGITPIASMPVVNRMDLGAGIGSTLLNGHIRRISYFPRRLTSSELEGITK